MIPTRLIPPCLSDPLQSNPPINLGACIGESLAYWMQLLFTATAIVAFLMIIYAGYQMITAYGNEAQLAQGKKTLQYAVLGMVISILAGVIVATFQAIFSGKF